MHLPYYVPFIMEGGRRQGHAHQAGASTPAPAVPRRRLHGLAHPCSHTVPMQVVSTRPHTLPPCRMSTHLSSSGH